MSKIAIPNHISNISERNFWSSFAMTTGDATLAEAVRLGKRGEKAHAYALLGDYHRRVLAGELAYYREQLLTAPPQDWQTAEDLLRHRITPCAWHNVPIDFGAEIDWNYVNTDRYGFHYMCWLQSGTRRVLETGEAVYCECLRDIITSYYRSRNSLDHNIPGLHLVYNELGSWSKSSQMLPLYLALLDNGEIPTEAHEAFMKLFLGFARSLYVIQSAYHGGNWQCVGCGALLTLARVFPEFTEHDAWEERALHYLKAHLADDFFADGGHKERCWGYGAMSLHGITDAYKAAHRHGGLGADERLFVHGIRKAYRWYAKTLPAVEVFPAFGDHELGARNHILDAAKPFFPAGTDRTLGVDRTKSYCLKPSGYAIMRNGGTEESIYLNLSFGQFAGWHAHMDLFSMNLWVYGQPLLEEVGRFGGYGEGLTILFRAPESHNQLTIDGMHFDNTSEIVPGKNSPPISGCGWDHPTFAHLAGRDPVWQSTPEADFFTAWHGAYRENWREPQTTNIFLRRTVVFVKDPGYVLVSDAAWEPNTRSDGPGFSVTQNWHSPFPFQQLAPGMARTDGDAASLLAFAPQPYLRRLETGADYTHDESPTDQEYRERHYLRARRWMPVDYRGATGVTVLLYPFRGEAPSISIETLPLDDAPLFRAGAFAINTPRGRDIIVLNPDRLPGVTFNGTAFTERCQVLLDHGHDRMSVK